MVTCKKFHATIPEKTCYARQKALHRFKNMHHGMQRFAQNNMTYVKYVGCRGCEIGLRVFNGK